MSQIRSRCNVCGQIQSLAGGTCKKAACLRESTFQDLPTEEIERILRVRAAMRKAGLIPREGIDGWTRRGATSETETFIRIRR